MPDVAHLAIRFDAEHGGFDRGLKHVENRVKGLSGQLKSAFGVGLGVIGASVIQGMVRGGVAQIESIVGAASDLNETKNKALMVFGADLNKDLVAWAGDAARTLGMSREQAIAAVASSGNFFQAQGLDASSALAQGQDIVQLATDLASFNNIDPAEVLANLSSGLAGEAEPLRKYGIDVSEAALAQEALAQGITKSTTEMSMAEKSQLRYAIIMKSTSKAQGDFGRTSGGLANQQRILAAKILDLKAALGGALLPVFIAGAGIAITLVTAFERLTHTVGSLIDIFADAFGSGVKVNDLLGRLPDSLQGVGKAALLAADAVGFLFRSFQKDGIDGVLKVLPDLLGQVFDELLNLGTIVISGTIALAGDLLDAAGNVIGWVLDEIAGGNWLLLAAMAIPFLGLAPLYITGAILLRGQIADAAGDLYGWVMKQIGVTSGGGSGAGISAGIGGSAPVTLEDVGVNIGSWLVDTTADLGEAVKDKITEWWPAVLTGIGDAWEATLSIGTWLIEGGSNLFTAVSDKIEEWWPIVQSSIGDAWEATLSIGTWLIEGGSNLFTAVSDKLDEWWPVVKASIGNAWDATLGIGTWLIEGGSALFAAVSDKLAEWWPIVQDGIGNAWDLTVEIGNWLIESSKPIWDSIKEFVTGSGGGGSGAGIGAGIGGDVVGLPAVAINVKDWLVSASRSIWDAITEYVTGGSGSGAGISAGIGGQRTPISIGDVLISGLVKLTGDFADISGSIDRELGLQVTEEELAAARASGQAAGAEFRAAVNEGFNKGGKATESEDRTRWESFRALLAWEPPFARGQNPIEINAAVQWASGVGQDFRDAIIRGFSTPKGTDVPANLFAGAVPDTSAGFASGAIDVLIGPFVNSFNAAAELIDGAVALFDGAVDTLSNSWDALVDLTTEWGREPWDMPELPSWLTNPMELFGGTGVGTGAGISAGIGGGVTDFGSIITTWFKDNITTPVEEAIAAFADWVIPDIEIPDITINWPDQPSLPTWLEDFTWITDPIAELTGLIAQLLGLQSQAQAIGNEGAPGGGGSKGFGGTPAVPSYVDQASAAMGGMNLPPGGVPMQAPIPVKFVAEFDATGVPAPLQPLVSGGAAPTLPSMKATLGLDIQQAGSDMAKAMQWGLDWDSRTFIADFNSDINQTGLAVANVMQWGLDWDSRVFVADFNADISQAGNAVATAMQWGLDWDGRVFTASFNVDTSGITNAVAVAAQAAADIDALMPHSLAKKGPLSHPVSFRYITDSLVAAMSNMGPAAERGMGDVADRLGRWSKVSPDLAGGSGTLGKWRYADGSGPGRSGKSDGVNMGGVTVQINAPVYGVADLQTTIEDAFIDRIIPGMEIALNRNERSWGLRS